MWGSEVYSPNTIQTSAQMGSGHFLEEGFSKASYIRNIQVVDSSNNLKSPSSMDLLSSQLAAIMYRMVLIATGALTSTMVDPERTITALVKIEILLI